jgi:peptide/nickel transport system substrate-binding protein
VVANVCDTLVRLRPDGRPAAALALSWATLDGRVWTFTLRQEVRFQDGARFDADAVVANVESLRRERAFAARAERLGPFAVSLTLERPNLALLATLSQPFFAMQSPRALSAGGAAVGTGPFRLASARAGQVELEADPRYWSDPPRLRRLVFRRFAGMDALVSALLSGEVDVTSALGHERLARLRAADAVTLDAQPGLNIAFLSVNNERKPFADPRVRQALARAVDREALIQDALGGHGEPARNPIPPLLPGYSRRSRELPLDRPAARRLLLEAGYPDGFETTLLVTDVARPYLPAPRRIAQRVREDLAQVGVRARAVPTAGWAEYLERGSRGDYDLMLLGWQADTTDPNDFLSALLGSESLGTTNRSRYRSPLMDALLKRGRMTKDPSERLAAYRDAQEQFQRDMPWVPLYHVSALIAYGKNVEGLVAGATVLRFEKVWKTR